MAAPVYHAPKKADDMLVFAREAQHGDSEALGLATPHYLARGCFARLAKKAGLPPTRVHVMRHFVASEWLALGVSIAEVARRLGNTPQVLLGSYTHATQEQQDVGVAELDALIHGR